MDMGYQACLALFQDLTFHQYLLPEESNAARQSLQVYLEFAAVNNNDQSASLESVTASERLSFLQLAFGEYRAAEQTLRPTVALLEDLARKKPTVTEYGWKLVNCYQNLAMALEKLNRCSEAEQAYRHSLRLDADVLDRRDQYPFAADARVNQRLGWGRIFFGRLLLRTGRLTEAEAAFRQGLMFGNSPFTRSFAMEGLARVFQSTDRLQEAEDGYRAVCQLWEQQLTAAPGNRHFQWKVAFASLQLGEFYEATGRDNEAGKEYRRALKIWEDLASEYASVPAYLRQQAWFLAASPLLELRNPARAVDLAKKAVELAPNDGNNWATLAAAHYRTGNWSEAQVALEKAMNLRPWGEGLDWFLLAMTQWRLGNTKGARQWFDKAVEWMAKNDAYNDDLRRLRSEAAELPDVAISREALVAEVLRRRAALDERAAAAPAARWERRQLAFDYYQHAVALRDVEQLSESEAVCRRALDAFRVLADEDPREIQFVYDIGWASHLLSDVLVRCRRFEEAAPLAREALARFQAVADSGPDRLEYRDAIAVAYAPLANLLAQLNQPEEAAQAQRDAEAARQAAEELRRTMPSARELLDSARPFAEKRDWTKAAAELNRGGEWQRSDLFLCFSTALARLLAGDIDGYARLVGGMQGLVPWKGSRWSRLDFLRTCTMHPRGAADPAALVPLARSACDEEANNWSAQNLAMVHYRAGEFDEALRWMERAQELGEWYLFFPALAMTHHQLGRSEEARLWLDKANTFFRDFAPPDGERLETLQGDPHWQDWAYFEVMLREARTLIGETGDLTETMLRSALRSRAEQPMIRDN
jgi:tetratricopeptide (TPR) repeat protein